MGKLTLAGVPNLVDTATITTGVTEVTDMEAANLAINRLSRRFRSTDEDLLNLYVEAELEGGGWSFIQDTGDADIDIAAIIALPGDIPVNTEIRFVLTTGNEDFPASRTRVAPDAVVSTSNVNDSATGSPPVGVTSIDEDPIGASDGNTWDAIAPSTDIDVTIGFPAPGGGNLMPGVGLQHFRIRISQFNVQESVDIYLKEAGAARNISAGEDTPSPVASISMQNVAEANALIMVPWDASVLSDASGADVEIRIVGRLNIDSVDWVAERDVLAAGSWTGDSGWLPFYPSDQFVGWDAAGDSFPFDPRLTPPQELSSFIRHHVFGNLTTPAPVADIEEVVVAWRNRFDYADWFNLSGFNPTYNNTYYELDMRRFITGRAVQLDALPGGSRNSLQKGSSIQTIHNNQETVGPSGGQFFLARPSYRIANLNLIALSIDNALNKIGFQLDRVLRGRNEALFLLDPDDDDQLHNLSIYGQVLSDPITFDKIGVNTYSRRLRIRERIS